MRYWWVNQNQTYQREVRGSFMWSPKYNANGARNRSYENMREVSPGDVVFSFCDTRLKSIGIVSGAAQTGPKPDFGGAGANWSQEGWYVPIDYCALNDPIRPRDHIELLPLLPAKYSPLRITGVGLQSVYLAEVPAPLADALIGLMGANYWLAYATITSLRTIPEPATLDEATLQSSGVGSTFREQLVRARRGQGVYRSNVLLQETHCRVTGVSEPRHRLSGRVTSNRYWRSASDSERLDGANGLLLSPHIDHLFDEGYITFTRSQELLLVPEVRNTLLDAWGIDSGVRVGEFSREQSAYLDYHFSNVFKKDLLEG